LAYLQQHPNPEYAEILAASAEARQESYSWLFKAGRKPAQNKRIRIVLEEDAFEKIWRDWRRLGYPFDRLVPSYATAIGSSADRPEALAELIGIIQNDGIWQPTARIEQLHFATDTPYETVLGLRPEPPKRLLAPEIAAEVKKALIDVVENGTARRLNKAYVSATGTPIVIGAKTGTGDNRRKTFARDGRLIDSEVMSRTATVAFFIGDSFFGNLTVYVPGHDAAGFSFTSSLPAQLLRRIAPALYPLIGRSGPRTGIPSLGPTLPPKLRATVDKRGRRRGHLKTQAAFERHFGALTAELSEPQIVGDDVEVCSPVRRSAAPGGSAGAVCQSHAPAGRRDVPLAGALAS
jgi:membrane peptidoglycan carboxypeptidase